MSCECLVATLLIEGRCTKSGSIASGNGIAQSCAPQDDGSHPTYANSKLTETYAGGFTKVTDYSTDLSENGGDSCPAPTVTWTPTTPSFPGDPTSSVWSVPVNLSDVRAQARSELVWNDWGTAPDFAEGATGYDTGYNAAWLTFQWGEASVLMQSINDMMSSFTPPGSAYDVSNSGVTGAQMNASVQRQQVRFTLGPPKLPMKLTWDIVNADDLSVVSSDSVTLTSAAPTHTVDVSCGSPAGTTQAGVKMANLHMFACPYHLG